MTRKNDDRAEALANGLLAFYTWTFGVYNCRTRAASLSHIGGPVLSPEAREQFLVQNEGSYPPVRRANALLGRGDRLLAASSFGALSWIDVPFLPNPHTLARPLPLMLWERFHDLDAVRQWLTAEGITHVLISRYEAEDIERESGFVSRWMGPLFEMNSFVLYRLK